MRKEKKLTVNSLTEEYLDHRYFYLSMNIFFIKLPANFNCVLDAEALLQECNLRTFSIFYHLSLFFLFIQ